MGIQWYCVGTHYTCLSLPRISPQPFTLHCTCAPLAAPEMANKQGYGLPYDMWSFGVIMFIVLSGFHPFDPEGDYPAAQVCSNTPSPLP